MDVVVPDEFKYLYVTNAERPVVKIPDPVLRKTCKEVEEVTRRTDGLIGVMLKALKVSNGIGLAAPQMGSLDRVIIVAPAGSKPLVLINPMIAESHGEQIGQEGCLSIPGLAADVERATHVVIKAQDRYGQEIRIKAYDWLARIFQHEIDHLHGVLMTDKAQKVYKLVKAADGEIDAIPIDEIPDFHKVAGAV